MSFGRSIRSEHANAALTPGELQCLATTRAALGLEPEHIPQQSFFPKDQRNQLLTVRSCELHNNKKSSDDIYVLAQICMNASPSNRSREVWKQSVLPQLDYSGEALRKTLASGAIHLPSGAVKYNVDTARVDGFFNALSCGIVFKACGERLPVQYSIEHVYHNFCDPEETPEEKELKNHLLSWPAPCQPPRARG